MFRVSITTIFMEFINQFIAGGAPQARAWYIDRAMEHDRNVSTCFDHRNRHGGFSRNLSDDQSLFTMHTAAQCPGINMDNTCSMVLNSLRTNSYLCWDPIPASDMMMFGGLKKSESTHGVVTIR